MDLYKHAFRLTPLVPSELVADCFELARDIRVVDMQASPYDLADLGFAPIRIETAEGKQEYAAAQRAFAERAAPLRNRLAEECTRLLELDRSDCSPSGREPDRTSGCWRRSSDPTGRCTPSRPSGPSGWWSSTTSPRPSSPAGATPRPRSAPSSSRCHPDYAALRRYLVDDQFLAREEGEYWRVGGSVDV